MNSDSNCSKVRLDIQTYLAGQNQATHPSVISFDEEWNGYRYWMAYTPYPYADGEEENPCIAASNDLYSWETPYGMVNPIADNEETGCNELKDSHILYREDLDRIEVWYLGRISENLGGDGTSLTLFRKVSYDGIHWSEYEVLQETEYLSQSVIWQDGKYRLWGIGYGETVGTLIYQESVDGIIWSDPQICSIDGNYEELDIWHGSVSLIDDEYIFVYIDTAENKSKIYACKSEDGVTFDQLQNPIVMLGNEWKSFYRPCLLEADGNLYCYYGLITYDNEWYISVSYGQTLDTLQGISDDGNLESGALIMASGYGLLPAVKRFLSGVRYYFRTELFIFSILFGFCLNRLRINHRNFANIGELLLLILIIGYTIFITQPNGSSFIYSLLACAFTWALSFAPGSVVHRKNKEIS